MLHTVLVMHQPLATAFAQCAGHVLGYTPDLTTYDIPADADVEHWCRQLAQDLSRHPADGLLVLCDLYGATPFNIACQAACQARQQGKVIEVVSGTNLNMVIKALTDPLQEIHALSVKIGRAHV